MSFWDQFFSDQPSELSSFWKKITSEKDVALAFAASHQKAVVIFKHSTRCIISKTVLNNFEKEVQHFPHPSLDYYYLDLLSFRDLSQKIAQDSGVTHQSPQVIVLLHGEVVLHASHEQISLQRIIEKINA